jgi:hypothetical protein
VRLGRRAKVRRSRLSGSVGWDRRWISHWGTRPGLLDLDIRCPRTGVH